MIVSLNVRDVKHFYDSDQTVKDTYIHTYTNLLDYLPSRDQMRLTLVIQDWKCLGSYGVSIKHDGYKSLAFRRG